MVGIISNTDALNAQINLNRAAKESGSSIARLSSGNRIDKASTDVAALAVGTILATNVNTLKAALNNTAQGNSMIGVADGGLKGISDLLARQKSLAASATSGSLSDAARGFLNQEFANLTEEIDRIAKTTNFNNLKLLDGSLFAPATIDTGVEKNATNASAKLYVANAFVAGADDDNVITINGVRLVARAAASMATGTPQLNFDITNNTTTATQAAAIYNTIVNVLNYQGTNATVLEAKQKLNELKFDYTNGDSYMKITSRAAGTKGNTIKVSATNITTASVLNLDGTALDNNTLNLATATRGVFAVDGDLSAGDYAPQGLKASGILRVAGAQVAADNGDIISINGGQIILRSTAGFTSAINEIEVQAVDTTAVQQAAAIKRVYDAVLNYSGADATMLANKAAFQAVDITYNTGDDFVTITAKTAGTAGMGIKISCDTIATPANLLLDNVTLGGTSGAALDLSTATRGAAGAAAQAEDDAVGTKASSVLEFRTAALAADTGIGVSINGATFTFRTNATMGTGQPLMNIDVTNITTTTTQAAALKTAIDNVKNYNGSDTALLTAKEQLADVDVTYVTGSNTLTITAATAGAAGNSIQIAAGNIVTAGVLYLHNYALDNNTYDLATASRGTLGTDAPNFARTSVRGTVGDNIIAAVNNTDASASGIDVSNISNNSAFVGKVQGFTATFQAPNFVNMSVKVGEYTYQAVSVNTQPTAATRITFNSVENGGGSFSVLMAANQGVAVNTQADVDNLFIPRINEAFDGVNFYQRRDVDSYTASGLVYPTSSTTPSGDLAGTSFKLVTNDFSDIKMEKVSVNSYVGNTDAQIQFTINGEVYANRTGIGKTIAANAKATFVNQTDPNKKLIFTNGATALSLNNASEAAGFQKALEEAFGVKTGQANVVFQVGTTSSDTIALQIKGAGTRDLYQDSNGVYTTVDLTTLNNALTANDVIERAINNVTALRADLGALQSRFEYASANISSSIINQDAARGTFLDTDVAAESTAFASSQVRLQASVSVLAQANQLPQSLLKLINQG